ncbi:MAG: hypothetical protein IKC42_01280 [Alistipes sp.]|nr:hypothetical protein [Alistipes sp.]
MKKFQRLTLVLLSMILACACSDSDGYSIQFDTTGMYFQWGDEPQKLSFAANNVSSIEVNEITDGWKCDVHFAERCIEVTPPEDPIDEALRDAKRRATITLTVFSTKGDGRKYTVSCYIIGDKVVYVNPNKEYANCYVLTTPVSAYTIDIACNGGGRELSGVVDVKVLWQTVPNHIEHLSYDESTKEMSFFIDCVRNSDESADMDGDNYRIEEGNALVAAVDAEDNVVWSWHLWIVSEENNPLNNYSTYSNGAVVMNQNLGSFGNSNGATDDNYKIRDSYGLYYQWGRKDPFPRPFYYDCSYGEDEKLYTDSGSITYVKVADSTEDVGTVEYAIAHPTTFITCTTAVGEEGDGIGDWHATHNSQLWNDTAKSEYDPSPYGWRVARASDLEVLTLSAAEDATEIEEARKRWGWLLNDGSEQHFYLAGGMRSYYDSIIYNMNYADEDVYPSQPKPWEGHYWTSTALSGDKSSSIYFDLTSVRSGLINKFHNGYPEMRANAMQVRCVKMQ